MTKASFDLNIATLSQESFYKERGTVLNDIDQFLAMVFRFLKLVEGSLDIDNRLQNLHLLLESLCLIHGLYGYPANGDDGTGRGFNICTSNERSRLALVSIKNPSFSEISKDRK